MNWGDIAQYLNPRRLVERVSGRSRLRELGRLRTLYEHKDNFEKDIDFLKADEQEIQEAYRGEDSLNQDSLREFINNRHLLENEDAQKLEDAISKQQRTMRRRYDQTTTLATLAGIGTIVAIASFGQPDYTAQQNNKDSIIDTPTPIVQAPIDTQADTNDALDITKDVAAGMVDNAQTDTSDTLRTPLQAASSDSMRSQADTTAADSTNDLYAIIKQPQTFKNLREELGAGNGISYLVKSVYESRGEELSTPQLLKKTDAVLAHNGYLTLTEFNKQHPEHAFSVDKMRSDDDSYLANINNNPHLVHPQDEIDLSIILEEDQTSYQQPTASVGHVDDHDINIERIESAEFTELPKAAESDIKHYLPEITAENDALEARLLPEHSQEQHRSTYTTQPFAHTLEEPIKNPYRQPVLAHLQETPRSTNNTIHNPYSEPALTGIYDSLHRNLRADFRKWLRETA